MLILFYLMLTQCLTVAKGIQTSRSSPLLESYGCIEKTNVTVILRRTTKIHDLDIIIDYDFDYDYFKLMKTLEDPCNTIFYFVQQSQKVIQWKGDRNEFEVHHKESSGDHQQYMDFIISLRDNQPKKYDTTIQILLIHLTQLSDEALKILEEMHKETSWKIIITCIPLECQTIRYLPINRIVPIHTRKDSEIRLGDLVRNPDFNKFEFLKYIKLDNVNLKCLENKTIHVFVWVPSLKLLENVALIAYNAQELYANSKIILYFPKWKINNQFWNYYLEKIGLNNIVNLKVVFVQESSEALPQSNILQTTKNDVFFDYDVLQLYIPLHLNRFSSYAELCNNVTKHFIYGNARAKALFDILSGRKTCTKNIEKVSFKDIDSFEELDESFIEEVLSASCF